MRRQLQLFILFFQIIILSSCGTFFSRDEYTRIDSRPRGVKVFSGGRNNFLGETPFILKKEKKRNLTLHFGNPDIKERRNLNCGINWGGSVIPNSLFTPLFFPIGLIIGAASFAVDFTSGGLYKCKDSYYFSLSHQSHQIIKEKKKTIPKRILILPLQHYDLRQTEKISKAFQKSKIWKDNFSFTDKILDPEKIYKDLSILGIDQFHEITSKQLKRRNFWKTEHLRVITEHKITHILLFEVINKRDKVGKKNWKLRPLLVDVFNLHEASLKIEKYFYYKIKNDLATIPKALRRAITLIPNGVSFSPFHIRQISFRDKSNSIVKRKKDEGHPDILPQLLSSIDLENVHDPYIREIWDFDFSFVPYLRTDAWKVMTFVNRFPYAIDLLAINFLYEAEFNLQTPLGAFNLGYAIGPGYFRGMDSHNNALSTFQWPTQVWSFTYTRFLSRRFYAKLAYERAYIPVRVSRDFPLEIKEWSSIFLSLGFYYPEAKYYVKKFLGFL